MSDTRPEDTAEVALGESKARSAPARGPAPVAADLGGLSHQGKVRANNEDHFLICRFGRFLEAVRTNLPDGSVPPRSDESGHALVVADGMGGHSAGEEASRLAISCFVNLVLHTPDWILRLGDEPLQREVMRRAAERYEMVNRALADAARADVALSGFGTTMTLAAGLGADLFIAHVGDSRAYRLRGGRLEQLTRDHTVAQEMLDEQTISPSVAAAHHLRHALTRSLGDHRLAARPDVTHSSLEDGDRLLLCSDGLTEMVDAPAIAEILGRDEPAQTICERLVERALAAGGRDNVTVVVALYRLA